MAESIKSNFGTFQYNQHVKSFKLEIGSIYWSLDNEHADLSELVCKAEELYSVLEDFNKKTKMAIAQELIDYKNDFWPEYDEDDETLDWDAVDAGEYDISVEIFIKAITLLDIEINAQGIYLEYDDGDLFGGHRIHAKFDYDYKLLQATI
ncbi:DUF2262 domain-containing protein [Lederbergia galactosidilytica]|uniref:DUF2262 domain-containing protein n=1 Tax=Lederbergia galactosidilytica TaxID=217031 RepID=A0A177ZHA6_9BACI|nr:DUF2262 domain-containing protein [Lederbergia galactosidilytica]KRG16466.1 hypothetical protein ACA30_01880 [Virgibacillus soli]MBP1914206.1 hypothetical protein [Lederbergia galactosidilytica]OAK67341.1 hypothetical protein ABB05_19505 [Lederbergia galactosidilytica]